MKFFCLPFACQAARPDALDFSQQQLEEVPRDVLKARKYLEELNLNVNMIEQLPLELFRCTKLKKLDVSENKIKLMPPEIAFLQSLMELGWRHNELIDIPDELGHCVNLVSLNLSMNIISELPKCIVNLKQLTSLIVADNSLTQLPVYIDELFNLQHLDASQCDLRFLPAEIVNLPRLRVLELCENNLTELPAGMEALSNLEFADLRKNMLTSIPVGLLSCSRLNSLDLSGNHLTKLPDNIGDLRGLVELTLCENSLISLPSSIGHLKRLQSLRVSRNTLINLTPAICSCVELRELFICDNQLAELPSSLGNLQSLRFFNASNNQLVHLPSTIGNCSALGVLALRHNKLKLLPMEIGKLENLRVLDVAENDLASLPFTINVLYERKILSALWLSLHQPPLPRLSATYDPISNVKVLTCCYLPQRDREMLVRQRSRSTIAGPRVCFGQKEIGVADDGQPIIADDDEENLPIGKFERYDTPHPKPFGAKNRAQRASGDFTAAAAAAGGDAAGQVELRESRQLRSVLKRRPQSTYSESAEVTRLNQLHESRKRLLRLRRGRDGQLGWTISGGHDAPLYRGRLGVYVSELRPYGAAERAGFCVGDRILAVNETTVTELNHRDIVQLIEEGGDELEVKIERIDEEADATAAAPVVDAAAIQQQKQAATAAAAVAAEAAAAAATAATAAEAARPAAPTLNAMSSVEQNAAAARNERPTASEAKLMLVEMAAEPRSASRQVAEPSTSFNAPLAQHEASDSPPPPSLSGNAATSRLASPTPPRGGGIEIISLVLKRNRHGSVGISITGSGAPNDVIRVSDLEVRGPAAESRKLAIGDRIVAVNATDVRNLSHDRVVGFLRSTNDVHLVVERDSRRVSSPHTAASRAALGLGLSNAALGRSLPSLVAAQARDISPPTELPPPLPPRRRASSRSNLIDTRQLEAFDFKSAIQAVRDMQPAIARAANRGGVSAPQPQPPPPRPTKLEGISAHDKPIATSSPVPPLPPATAAASSSSSSSSTTVIGGGSMPSRLPARTTTTSRPLAPPPLAPKPRPNAEPELRAFDEKRRCFEQLSAAPPRPPSSRPAGPPPSKKPLVHEVDLARERERARRSSALSSSVGGGGGGGSGAGGSSADEDEHHDYERLLTSAIPMSVARASGGGEKRASAAAAAAAASAAGSSMSADDALSPPLSANASASDLDERKAEQKRRQAWRKKRMDSMEICMEHGDEVIKLISSSPIPT